MWHSFLPFGFCAFRFPHGDGVGLPIHCQGRSQLTQVVGGAEPGQSVYLGGAGAGRDLIASSCFLLECRGVPAGLRGWCPAHHTWVKWLNEWEVPWWMPDERALHRKLKSACSGVPWNGLKPAVMRYLLVLVYALPRSAPISVALLKLPSSICLGSFPGSFLCHYRVNALEMGLLRPSFCPSRAPGNCSVIECFRFWQISYSFNKYLRPYSVLGNVLGTWDKTSLNRMEDSHALGN